MSGEQEDVSSHPLVIVRRRRNTEEEHHGGVWKIAYADFMTAMMAFFLVMWLINAADKKTIVQVAAYFNPMRLTDRHAEPKGLQDLIEAESRGDRKGVKGKGSEKQIDKKKKLQADHAMREKVGEGLDEFARKTNAAAGGKSFEVQKEQALFDDPGKLLERLASQAKASQPTTASSPVDGNLSDPFDRLNRRSGKAQPLAKPLPPTVPGAKNQYAASKQPSNVKPEDAAKDAQKNSAIGEAAGKQATAPTPKPEQAAAAEPSVEGKIEAKKQALSALPANVQQVAKELAALEIKKRDEAREQAKKDAEVKEEAKAKKLDSEISSAIARVSKDLPNVEVKATPEGLLVSLTDDANFGMFEVGSAKPRPELVVTMSKVGEVLEKVGGKIVVRGHTDSRAYRNGNYDNWRLSSARAQMAYYMLIRGGLDKSRVVAIEGRADRDPKIPSDPEAAQNRRIEILIKEDKQ